MKKNIENDSEIVEKKFHDGRIKRFLNGKLHCETGPAVEYPDGQKEWWLNGKRHRENNTAIEDGTGIEDWWLNGKRHREDGPAFIVADYKEWWIRGKKLSEQEFNSRKLNKELSISNVKVRKPKI